MYRTILNDKIGNLLSYLTFKISSLSLTKALKLLYLIDEMSVLESGSPITFLDYKVWENGPVAHELYDELKYVRKIVQGNIEYSFDDFIDLIRIHNTSRLQEEVFLKNKSIPNLTEFCQVEIELIDKVLKKYGNKSATQLIDILHKEGTLWSNTIKEQKIDFKIIHSKKTDVSLNFANLIQDNEFLQMASASAYESLSFKEEVTNLISQ
jgi:uncharacterized phage-associated protein